MSTQQSNQSTHDYDDFDWETPVEKWPEGDQIAVIEAAAEISPRIRDALSQSSAADSSEDDA